MKQDLLPIAIGIDYQSFKSPIKIRSKKPVYHVIPIPIGIGIGIGIGSQKKVKANFV